LLATYHVPLELYLDSVGSQSVLYWFDSSATLEESADLIQWSPSPGVASPLPINCEATRQFFRLGK
jgi:hypothetical protein